jgi:hypothetical protein
MGTTAVAQPVAKDISVNLPDGARKVGENRYKSPGDWEQTMKHYKSAYPKESYPRKNIIHQPGVNALHIANPSGKGGWEGLNIYLSNEEVRIYVVPAGEVVKKPPLKKK